LMLGLFAVVPNISAFVQHNLGYPRDRIGLLYLVGGIASFVVMRIVGALVDRFGATAMVALGTLLHAIALISAFVMQPVPWFPVLLVFTVFMLSGSVRMVPLQTLASRVPRPEQRARFMSAQSAVQHAASAVGAVLASLVLVAAPDGKLLHMDQVALVALGLACLVPIGAGILERRVRAREAVPR
jgi:predicted MFS family arabinose efflux permease